MRLIISSVFVLLLLAACSETKSGEVSDDSPARFVKAVFEQSEFIADKVYEVYLPASYAQNSEKSYPVLYMMDRQNLFVRQHGLWWSSLECP